MWHTLIELTNYHIIISTAQTCNKSAVVAVKIPIEECAFQQGTAIVYNHVAWPVRRLAFFTHVTLIPGLACFKTPSKIVKTSTGGRFRDLLEFCKKRTH